MPMYAYGFMIGIALVVVFWFFFVAPMERQMHERKMKMMKRKLKRNEERLKQLSEEGNIENIEGDAMPAEKISASGGE